MKVNDFDKFFEEIHGYSPFPWQRRLIETVMKSGWPETISLPTASGKTSVIDIALFSMALEAHDGTFPRKMPRRVFFTVDRRLVVDEAYKTSKSIQNLLLSKLNEQGIIGEVARVLLELSGDNSSTPLDVIRLRGGMPHEPVFIHNPLQPTVILSTVDQVGSRILLRGYGVSEFMLPVHAALVGKDSLIIVDEAHLSQPFIETLKMVQKYQDKQWSHKNVGNDVVVVSMTATPFDEGGSKFLLEKNDWNDKILEQRFKAPKHVKLVNYKMNSENQDNSDRDSLMKDLAKRFSEESRSILSKINGNPVIGIVVNTVALANTIYDQLSDEENAQVVKIIGTIRPYDRDALLEKFLPRIKAGRKDDANPVPLYVIATQTIEVGANIDFDALVTENAPIDALRQRFGRLNRLGSHPESHGVIIYSAFRKETNEAIYGESWNETWKWMEKLKKEDLDFGVQSMEKIIQSIQRKDIYKLLTPKLSAPLLTPSHMDMLVQTSPHPAIEPDISMLLHGPKLSHADVLVVWRSDFPDILRQDDNETVIDSISLIPPTSYEAVSIPIWALKARLKKVASDFSDVEGNTLQTQPGRNQRAAESLSVFLWLGQGNGEIIGVNDINPGQTLVLPSAYGGYDQYGWNPSSDYPVKDIADISAFNARGKRVMRVHPAFMRSWFDDSEEESVSQCSSILTQVLDDFNNGEDLHDLVDTAIDRILDLNGLNPPVADALIEWRNLKGRRTERIYPATGPMGIILEERRRTAKEFTDDDDTSSYTERVTLEMHSEGVEKQSRTYAQKIGLDQELCMSIAAAGLMHDLGKADPRFQSWLRGEIIGEGNYDVLLAKSSGSGIVDLRAISRARQVSRYPKGGRHECYSVGIIEANPQLLNSQANNAELVKYLIGSHHGRGRAMMPAVEDNGMDTEFVFMGKHVKFHGVHGLERIDSGWPELFWKLVRKYGYWGLSYLETIVRLGDHTESALEVKNNDTIS